MHHATTHINSKLRHNRSATIRAATVTERFPLEQAGRQHPPIKHPSTNSTNRFLTGAALIGSRL